MKSLKIASRWLVGAFIICTFDWTLSERIIISHTAISYSHLVQTWPLAEALAKKGHDVTIFAPFPYKEVNPNITVMIIPEHAEVNRVVLETVPDLNQRIRGEMPDIVDMLIPLLHMECEVIYSSPTFKSWLKKNPKADLVIIDNSGAECGVGLAYKLGAKHVYFSTISVLGYEYDSIGFVPESSVIPEQRLFMKNMPLGFLDRIQNGLRSLVDRYKHLTYVQLMDEMLRRTLEVKDMPPLDDLVSNPSLILYTGDVANDYPRSLPPLYVNIAGIHAWKPTKDIPKDLENFIQSNATSPKVKSSPSSSNLDDGFIYISLGSCITSHNLPANTKKIFFDVIRSYPHIKFLWKWNGELPSDIPDNLHLASWYPQIDLLAHPKIRGFISQAGRPSMTESVYQGVPMIAFPILGDQPFNIQRLEEAGAGIKLEISLVTFEELKNAVERVLYDPSIKAGMKRLQKITRDRPMSPVDTAVWYTEYVLRHPDTKHLKPMGSSQNWFIRRQIDVWATLTIVAVLLFFGILTISVKLFGFLFPSPAKKLKTK